MTQGLYWFGFETPYFPFEDGVSVLLEPMCSKRWGVTSFLNGEWTGVLLRVSYLSYVGDPSPPLLYLKVGPIYRALLLCTEKSWWLESSCFVSRGESTTPTRVRMSVLTGLSVDGLVSCVSWPASWGRYSRWRGVPGPAKGLALPCPYVMVWSHTDHDDGMLGWCRATPLSRLWEQEL